MRSAELWFMQNRTQVEGTVWPSQELFLPGFHSTVLQAGMCDLECQVWANTLCHCQTNQRIAIIWPILALVISQSLATVDMPTLGQRMATYFEPILAHSPRYLFCESLPLELGRAEMRKSRSVMILISSVIALFLIEFLLRLLCTNHCGWMLMARMFMTTLGQGWFLPRGNE